MTPPTIEHRPLPIFPCYPDKRPACAHGFKDATTDPKRIRRLWAGRTGLLVGVPTGEASGISVIDLDQHWPDEALLPETRVHETKSGGRHYLYRHRPGLKCSQGLIAPGVDVRADGGYTIWWPAAGYGVVDRPIAEWPEGVLKVNASLRRDPPQIGSNATGGSRTAANVTSTLNPIGRISHLYRQLENMRRPGRGTKLNFVAVVFGNLVAEGHLRQADAERILIYACKANGLWSFDGEKAVRREIARGLAFGFTEAKKFFLKCNLA